MQYLLTEYELREFAHEVAGRSSVPFIKANPQLVMPSEELCEGVNDVLQHKFGIGSEQLRDETAGMEMKSVAAGEPFPEPHRRGSCPHEG